MTPLKAIERLYNSIRLFLHLLFLRLHLFILQQIEYRTAPAKATSRTALIIGDAVALGVGDSAGKCGLATRIPAMLRSRREDCGLRLYWHVVTAGVLRSKAAEWMPGAKARLFENALVYGPFKNSDVVVVLMGAHDDLVGDGEVVVEAIARVVEGIVRLGKHAVVATLPNEYSLKSREHAKVREINGLLRRKLEAVSAENSGKGCGSLSLGVEMAKVFAMGNDVLSFENDFITLNGAGYRLLTNETLDAFVPAAKKVEWVHWKQKLEANRSDLS